RRLLMRELYLEDHVTVAPERQFRAAEVELEHPAEALIVQRRDRILVGDETPPPVPQRLCIMQPQHLDIGRDQAAVLDPWQHLRQCRAVAAGENVFPDPGIGAARTVTAADRV